MKHPLARALLLAVLVGGALVCPYAYNVLRLVIVPQWFPQPVAPEVAPLFALPGISVTGARASSPWTTFAPRGSTASYLVRGQHGTMWAISGGLGCTYASRFDGLIWTSYQVDSGQPPDVSIIGTLVALPDGTMLYGAEDRVLRFDGQAWSDYTIGGLPTGSSVDGVRTGADGVMWVSSRYDGVFRFDGHQWIGYRYRPHSGRDVDIRDFAIAPDGSLWLATMGNGVLHLQGENWTAYTTSDGLSDNEVDDIVATSDGAVWAMLHDRNLARFDGQRWTLNIFDESLHLASIRHIGPALDGDLWVAGNQTGHRGPFLSKYDDHWSTYRLPDADSWDSVSAMQIASDGTVWLATGDSGVYGFDGQAWTHFTARDGLASDDVTSIAIGSDGALWFATRDAGISRYRP